MKRAVRWAALLLPLTAMAQDDRGVPRDLIEQRIEAAAEQLGDDSDVDLTTLFEVLTDRYTDPIERLAAFLVAGATGRANPHEEIALAQYRIDLAVHRPEDLATVQTPVIRLVKQLVQDAMDAGALVPGDADPAVFLLLTLKSARLHADILGNELGVRLPDAMALARFCIEGLGGKFPVGFPKA